MDNVLDILAVLIGFSAVMLLLSLLVTALVQALQNRLQVRSRNLRLGLESLLQTLLVPEDPEVLRREAKATHRLLLESMEQCRDVIEPPSKSVVELLGGAAAGVIDRLPTAIELANSPDSAPDLIAASRYWDDMADVLTQRASDQESSERQVADFIAAVRRVGELLRETARVLRREQKARRLEAQADEGTAAGAVSNSTIHNLTRDVIERARFTPEATRETWLAKLGHFFSDAPALSWIEPKELVLRLRESGIVLDAHQREQLDQFFTRMEDYTRKRLIGNIRWITFGTALAVAIVFQVSAPGLLRDLSVNPEMRARYVDLASGVLDEAQDVIRDMPTYEKVSEAALVELQSRHPQLASQIEQAAGIGRNREEIVAELALIFEQELPERKDAIVKEYESILDGLHGEAADKALGHARDITQQLARVDITPLARGWPYYQRLDNWIGMLMTATLLTLGAPFWYETLRNLAGLRDALKPQSRNPSRSREGENDAQSKMPEEGRPPVVI